MAADGTRIGLALGAGGARGFAHIGVLRALCQAEVRLHAIGGSSMGGLVGAAFAGGISPDDLERMILETDLLKVAGFYLSRLRVGWRSAVGRKMLNLGAGVDFEDLAIPCAVVCWDMVSRERVILDRGPVIKAVEATIAIPVVSAPAIWEGRCLADGGIIDSVPVDVPRMLGATVVVAVNVDPDATSVPRPAGRLLRRAVSRMLPFLLERTRHDPMCWMGQLARLVDVQINGPPSYSRQDADVVIRPETGRIGGNAFYRAKEIIRAGEMAAVAMMPAIRQLSEASSSLEGSSARDLGGQRWE